MRELITAEPAAGEDPSQTAFRVICDLITRRFTDAEKAYLEALQRLGRRWRSELAWHRAELPCSGIFRPPVDP